MSIHDAMSEDVARFDALLEELSEADTREPVLALAKRLVRMAEELVAAAPRDADAHHLLGLAWYHHPGSTAWRSWHCRAALDRALALEPTHQGALRSLAHLLFDQERYSEALEVLERVDLGGLAPPADEWRRLKLMELALVCRLRMAPDEVPRGLDEFRAEYVDARRREDDDVRLGSTVPASELAQCGEWLFESGAATTSSPLRDLLEVLDEVAPEARFWNRELERRRASRGSGE